MKFGDQIQVNNGATSPNVLKDTEISTLYEPAMLRVRAKARPILTGGSIAVRQPISSNGIIAQISSGTDLLARVRCSQSNTVASVGSTTDTGGLARDTGGRMDSQDIVFMGEAPAGPLLLTFQNDSGAALNVLYDVEVMA